MSKANKIFLLISALGFIVLGIIIFKISPKNTNLAKKAPQTSIESINNSTSSLENIRKKIQEIDVYAIQVDKNLKKYTTCESSTLDLSTEGASLVFYYKAGALIKIKAKIYGEMAQVDEDIYFKGGSAIFVKNLQSVYNVPIYMEGNKVISTNENKYYFEINETLFYGNEEGIAVNPKSTRYTEPTEGFRREFNILRKDPSCKQSSSENSSSTSTQPLSRGE